MKDWLSPGLFTYAACVPMAIKSNSGLWKQIHVIPHIMSGNLNVNKKSLANYMLTASYNWPAQLSHYKNYSILKYKIDSHDLNFTPIHVPV